MKCRERMNLLSVLCLLLATSPAWGASIQLDTSALSHPQFRVLPSVDWTDKGVGSVELAPGHHTLQTNSNTAGYASVPFDVLPNGTVSYAPQYEGVLQGKDTSALKVNGTPVLIHTRALSHEEVNVDALSWSSTDTVRKLTLLPGKHELKFNCNTVYNYIAFTVTPHGTIVYETSPQTFAAGEGTNTVLVRGHVIYLDATAFTGGLVIVDRVPLATRFVIPLVLVPGTHELRKQDASGNSAPVYFTVANDGQVSASGAAFSVQGTDTLLLH